MDLYERGIERVVPVISGKGGVGKSSCALQLALSLCYRYPDAKIGLLDIDLCGPSIPRMLNVKDASIRQGPNGWEPVEVGHQLKVMSVGFLLAGGDDAVIWRGPKKTAMIRQFLGSTDWGKSLQWLIVDTPPGTSDEHLTLMEVLHGHPWCRALLVTTPQMVSLNDVRKQIDFCRQTNLTIWALLENMSGYHCAQCGECTRIFSTGGGEQLALDEEIRFAGRLPISPAFTRLCEAADANPFVDYRDTELYSLWSDILSKLLE